MTILTFPADTFDKPAHFAFEYLDFRKRPTRGEGYLFRDDEDGQVYLMKASACLKDHYTAADRAHTDRIYVTETPVRDGDVVEVEGQRYRVRILGNYSDAGRLTLLEGEG